MQLNGISCLESQTLLKTLMFQLLNSREVTFAQKGNVERYTISIVIRGSGRSTFQKLRTCSIKQFKALNQPYNNSLR
jgi:hypothetical protein